MAEQQRFPTTAELDLEARQQEDYVSPLRVDGNGGRVTENQDQYAVKGNDTSQYVGVSPEYMTYANKTERPLAPKEGVEADAEKSFREGAPTVVKAPETPVATEPVEGTGTSVETVTTALSGSALQAKVATPKVTTEAGKEGTDEKPVTPPAPPATPPAAK